MSKLTKAQSKAHRQAEELLKKDTLTHEEIEFIFSHWHEGQAIDQTFAGAFFTPPEMAQDFRIEVDGERILDLCAGIGVLSYYAYHFGWYRHDMPKREIVCIERCPRFVEIGKKILPQATWICADVFDFDYSDLGHFDSVISNPPFSNVKTYSKPPRYTGSKFEYKLIDLAADLGDYGAFIIPQQSAPFDYSNRQHHSHTPSREHSRFFEQTKIRLAAGCGIDTAYFNDNWKQKVPQTEIACCDFTESREARKPAQSSLFEMVA